jgi:hypothetical protein
MTLTEKFNKEHTITELAAPLMAYLVLRGEVKNLSNQSLYPGVKIFSSENMNGAVTLGNMIFINPGMERRGTLSHEYGHFLDFKYHFRYNHADYIKGIGIPSIISAGGSGVHFNSSTEVRANILGGAYHNINLYRPN